MESYKFIGFTDAYFDEDNFWVINEVVGGLYKINVKNFESQYMSPALSGKRQWIPSILRVMSYKNTIIFFPWNTSEMIIIYDKQKNLCESIPFPCHTKKVISFSDIVQQEQQDTFFFFPTDISAPFIQFSPDTRKFKYSDFKWGEKIKPYITNKDLRLYVGLVTVCNKVWMPLYKTSTIIETDLKNGIVQAHHIDKMQYKFGTIAYDGSLFWISLTDQYGIISWDSQNDITTLYSLDTIYPEGDRRPYSAIVCINKQVILLPSSMKELQLVDKSTGTIKKLQNYPNDFYIFKNRSHDFYYWRYYILGNRLIVYPLSGNMLLEVDIETFAIIGHKLLITKSHSKSLWKNYYQEQKENIYNEESDGTIYSLEGLCTLLSPLNQTLKAQMTHYNEQITGTEIWNYIKEIL